MSSMMYQNMTKGADIACECYNCITTIPEGEEYIDRFGRSFCGEDCSRQYYGLPGWGVKCG